MLPVPFPMQPDSPIPRLWIVAPVYLDSRCALELRQRIDAVLSDAPRFSGLDRILVFVDDSGGTDPGIERLESAGCRVITPPFNLGHQRALVFGLRSLAREVDDRDLVVTMDSDGEDRPEDLPRLLSALIDAAPGRRGIVLARRTSRTVSLTFRILYFFFARLFRVLTGTLVRSGNFAVFRGWLVRHVLFHPHFDLCYSSSLLSLNLEVRFEACARGQRYAGESRMNYMRLISHGISMFMPFLDRIAVRMLVVLTSIIGSAAMGFLFLALAHFGGGRLIAGETLIVLGTVTAVAVAALPTALVLFSLSAQARSAALMRLEFSNPSTERGL